MTKDLSSSYFGEWYECVTWTHVLLLLNAICGLLIFEWAWYKNRRFRYPIAELNAQFPELMRTDTHMW